MQPCDHWFQHNAASDFIGHIASPSVSLLQATKIRVANWPLNLKLNSEWPTVSDHKDDED